jgi:hypothetical protein
MPVSQMALCVLDGDEGEAAVHAQHCSLSAFAISRQLRGCTRCERCDTRVLRFQKLLVIGVFPLQDTSNVAVGVEYGYLI